MDQFMDFTYDPTKFGSLPDLVKDLHAHDQRYVMILVIQTFIDLTFINLVDSLTQMVIVPGFSTRTLGSAALSPRAPIGRLTRG